jgi:hypothetical protein
MVYQVFAKDVTIPSGSSTSDPIPITGLIIAGIVIPSVIAGTRLGLQLRQASTDPFRLLTGTGGPIVVPISANSYAVFPREVIELFPPLDAIRIVTLDNTNLPVNQTSNVTLRVFLAPS